MKKILLLVVYICVAMSATYAQCVPDPTITHNVTGIYPDSATGLPHAIVGDPYSATIQLKVVHDTTYLGQPATVDSILITSVSCSYPGGITYLCTPSTCHFVGGSDACILLQAPAPTAGMAGLTYPIIVHVTAYGHVLGGIPASISDNINRYNITVDPNVGVASLSLTKFDVAQNIPNPFKESTMISFSSPSEDLMTLKISNLLGKVVYTKPVHAQKGLNKIELDSKDFYPGIYIYNIGNSKGSVTRRMIVSNE